MESVTVNSPASEIGRQPWGFGQEIIRAPAMIMALGIFLLHPGRFLLEALLSAELAGYVLAVGIWLLALLAGGLVCLIVGQTRRDASVLWGYTLTHFAIGTWVAGTNVLSRAMEPIWPVAGHVLCGLGWVLWLSYMGWLVRFIRQRGIPTAADGTVLLIAVATQSIVLATLACSPRWPGFFLYILLGLNILGLVLYGLAIYAVWIVRGVREQLAHWAPQNNITHGALSISILAAVMLAERLPEHRALFAGGIAAGWMLAAACFVVVFLLELNLLMAGRPLLQFRTANYARNFTYGMFFAASSCAAAAFPGSIVAAMMSRPVLAGLALLVAVVNAWEVTHHLSIALRSATPLTEAKAI